MRKRVRAADPVPDEGGDQIKRLKSDCLAHARCISQLEKDLAACSQDATHWRNCAERRKADIGDHARFISQLEADVVDLARNYDEALRRFDDDVLWIAELLWPLSDEEWISI